MKTILLVDDEPDFVKVIKMRLEANGYQVITASDGQEGVKIAKSQSLNLIIMDIMMPRMPGGEAVKLLKSNDQTKNIPIIFFTAMNTYLPIGTEFNKINVDGQLYPAIAKPFDPITLLSTIKSILGE